MSCCAWVIVSCRPQSLPRWQCHFPTSGSRPITSVTSATPPSVTPSTRRSCALLVTQAGVRRQAALEVLLCLGHSLLSPPTSPPLAIPLPHLRFQTDHLREICHGSL